MRNERERGTEEPRRVARGAPVIGGPGAESGMAGLLRKRGAGGRGQAQQERLEPSRAKAAGGVGGRGAESGVAGLLRKRAAGDRGQARRERLEPLTAKAAGGVGGGSAEAGVVALLRKRVAGAVAGRRWSWRGAVLRARRALGQRGGRRWRVLGGVSVGLLAVAFGGVVYGVDRAHHGGAGVAHVADAPRGGAGSDAVLPARGAAAASPARLGTGPAPLARSTPLTLAIPSVRLSAPLLGLGMDGKGAAELPPFSLPRTAGWLRDSASPGEAGTAVVVGHVDTTTGPAVFWNLAAVRTGAEVDVARLDGRTAVFTVDRVRGYPKAAFPTAQVYGPSPGAQLRVVTCGGAFDRARREYTGNVVLFAHLSGVR